MKTPLFYLSLTVTILLFGTAASVAQMPPTFPDQPVGSVVDIGSSVVLTAKVSGTNVGYQWLKDGIILRSQTNDSISFDSFQFTNSGSYQVMATNAYGMAISLPAALNVPDAPLQVWGLNSHGELGNGTTTQQGTPINIESNVVTVTAGGEFTLFVKSDGTLWDMGYNLAGQLGDGTSTSTNRPICVASNVVAIAAGQFHSLFIKDNGTLWGMGANNYGQLGTNTIGNSNFPIFVSSNVVSVAAGSSHSLFVKNNGTLWAMGFNNYGQLGNGNTTQQTSPVNMASNVVAVAAGTWHSLFIKNDGTLWAMGYNRSGQLGNGKTSNTNLPICVASNAVAVAAGNGHSLFMKSDGSLWAMGYNGFGQLGNGNTTQQNTPVNIASNVVAVTAGASHSLFTKSDGSLWAMGYNNFGQLGNGTTTNTTVPIQIPGLTAASLGVTSLANFSLAEALLAPNLMPLGDQETAVGQLVTFTMIVTNGTGPFSYQWQFNHTNIADATNTSYTIPAAVFSDAGTYTGIVAGMEGTGSNSAALKVTLPPVVLIMNSSNKTGNLQFSLPTAALAGNNFVLQATTNLANLPWWVPIQTNVADAFGQCLFKATNSIAPEMFYRITKP